MKTITGQKLFSLSGIISVFLLLNACASDPSPWTKQSSPWDQRRESQAAAPAADQYKQDLAAVDQDVGGGEVELSYQAEPLDSPASIEAGAAEADPEEAVLVAESEPSTMMAEDEIMNQPADYYTVQLFASRDMDRLYRFAEQNQLSVRYAISTVRDGVTWHVLLLGIYSDYLSAKVAMAEVADSMTTKPWIRSLGSLQKLMQ